MMHEVGGIARIDINKIYINNVYNNGNLISPTNILYGIGNLTMDNYTVFNAYYKDKNTGETQINGSNLVDIGTPLTEVNSQSFVNILNNNIKK